MEGLCHIERRLQRVLCADQGRLVGNRGISRPSPDPESGAGPTKIARASDWAPIERTPSNTDKVCPAWWITVGRGTRLVRCDRLIDRFTTMDGGEIDDLKFADQWRFAVVRGLSDDPYSYLVLCALVFDSPRIWKDKTDGANKSVRAIFKSPFAYKNSVFEGCFGFGMGGRGFSSDRMLLIMDGALWNCRPYDSNDEPMNVIH